MAFDFSKLPSIETERLILRRMKPTDADDIFEFTSSPEGKEFLSWDVHKDTGYTKSFIESMNARPAQGLPEQWGVELKNEQKIIGIIGLISYLPAHNRGEFTYILSQNYLGKGYMTEASAAFFRFCFEEIGLMRLEGKNEPDHYATHKIIEKLGMQREGLLRKLLFQKGRYRDFIWWSILKDDYDIIKETLDDYKKPYKVVYQ